MKELELEPGRGMRGASDVEPDAALETDEEGTEGIEGMEGKDGGGAYGTDAGDGF